MRFKVTYVLGAGRVSVEGVPTAREIVCTMEEHSLHNAMLKVNQQLSTHQWINLVDDKEKGRVVNVAAIQCVNFDVF